jgi:hypothetical protein
VVPPCARDLRLEFEEARRSVARLTWVRRWHVSSKLTLHPRPKQPRPMSGSPQLCWSRGARRPSRLHLSQAGTRAADFIGLSIAGSPRSRRRSTSPERKPCQPSTYTPTSTKTGGGCDAHGYIDLRHREREERELRRCLDYDREYGPPGGVHWCNTLIL